jgi:hypothetical protein
MIHGTSHGEFIDAKKNWPIFARAEKLDVPIYLHPALPNATVTDIYYKDYAKDFPLVVRPAWGFTVETATQAIRLVLSGVFDAHPNLKIVLGHLGETLPFLDRCGAQTARAEADELSRHLQQEFLSHHQRLFLQSGVAVLHDGDGRRPHPVRGRLAVRGQSAGRRLDEGRAAVGRRQSQDIERQCQAAVEDVSQRWGWGAPHRCVPAA